MNNPQFVIRINTLDIFSEEMKVWVAKDMILATSHVITVEESMLIYAQMQREKGLGTTNYLEKADNIVLAKYLYFEKNLHAVQKVFDRFLRLKNCNLMVPQN